MSRVPQSDAVAPDRDLSDAGFDVSSPRQPQIVPMFVTRFAPSPTGLLHLGHAFAALTAYAAGRRFLVRIEDIDSTRSQPEFEAAIFEDLAWLGLDWEKPVLRQSERFGAYREALDLLRARR